ncbi:MAG: hypothetical protein ACREN6_15125 [Gemmatimonadaceae bacterium]
MAGTARLLISACALLGACARDAILAPVPPADHDVQGSWGEDFADFPGNSFLIAVTESSGAVSGTGSFAGEAGPYGGLVVSGSIAADSLRLQIIYDFEPMVFPGLHPDTAQFVGVLASEDTISGQLTRGGFTTPLTLGRLKLAVDPP